MTGRIDTYFSVPGIQPYLIADPVRKVVIHHARGEGDDTSWHTTSSGEIGLTPPGMAVSVAEMLPEIG